MSQENKLNFTARNLTKIEMANRATIKINIQASFEMIYLGSFYKFKISAQILPGSLYNLFLWSTFVELNG